MNRLNLKLEINVASKGNVAVDCVWDEEFLSYPTSQRLYLLQQIIISMQAYLNQLKVNLNKIQIDKVPVGKGFIDYQAPIGEAEPSEKASINFAGSLVDITSQQRAVCIAASVKYLIGVGQIFMAHQEKHKK